MFTLFGVVGYKRIDGWWVFFAMAQGFCLRKKQQQTVSGLLAKRPKDLQHFGAVYLAAVVVQFQVFTQPGCKPCLTFFFWVI